MNDNDNVVYLKCQTTLDIPIERVLERAKESLEGGIVIGWDKEGSLYIASSYGDKRDVLWLLENAKKDILE